MVTKQIAWNTGSGNITLTYQGQGDGTITVVSDQNDLATARSQTITIQLRCPNCGSKHFHHATNERNMEIYWCYDCGKEFI